MKPLLLFARFSLNSMRFCSRQWYHWEPCLVVFILIKTQILTFWVRTHVLKLSCSDTLTIYLLFFNGVSFYSMHFQYINTHKRLQSAILGNPILSCLLKDFVVVSGKKYKRWYFVNTVFVHIQTRFHSLLIENRLC